MVLFDCFLPLRANNRKVKLFYGDHNELHGEENDGFQR